MQFDTNLSFSENSNPHGLQWMVLPDGGFQSCGRTRMQLPPGGYACTQDCYGRSLLQPQQCSPTTTSTFPMACRRACCAISADSGCFATASSTSAFSIVVAFCSTANRVAASRL